MRNAKQCIVMQHKPMQPVFLQVQGLGLGLVKYSLECRHFYLFLDIANQVPPSCVLHDEVKGVVGKVHVQQTDDVGVLQARQHADLVLDLVYLSDAAEGAGVHRLHCYGLTCTSSFQSCSQSINFVSCGPTGGQQTIGPCSEYSN